MITVSIIIPVYNVKSYLENCVNSVLNQNFKDFEVILVDDGSSDECSELCDYYAYKDGKIVVIHKVNGGVSVARNVGIKAASGKYVLFVDSDDTIELDLLSKTIPVAEKDGSDIVIFGMKTEVFEGNELIANKYSSNKEQEYIGRKEILKHFTSLSNESLLNFPVDKLYRADVIKKNQIFFDTFYDGAGEDTVFILELLPFVNKIHIIDGHYYNYFIRNSQSTVKSFIYNRYEKFYGRFKKTEKLIYSFERNQNDMSFLYTLYCSLIMWAYEFMFHKDCKMSFIERYKYIKRTFSIRKESRRFCKEALCHFKSQKMYLDASESTKKVLKNIMHKRYFCAWGFHVLALLKNR